VEVPGGAGARRAFVGRADTSGAAITGADVGRIVPQPVRAGSTPNDGA
jgi:hypothetical protein